MSSLPKSKGNPTRSVEVQILGQRMLLKSDDDPRHVERLANYVKRKIDEVGLQPVNSSNRLARCCTTFS